MDLHMYVSAHVDVCSFLMCFLCNLPALASWITSETITIVLMKGNNGYVSVNNVCLSGFVHVSLFLCVRLLDMNLNLRQAARHHLCSRGNEFSAFTAVELTQTSTTH